MSFRSIILLSICTFGLYGEDIIDHCEYKTIGTCMARQKTVLGSQVEGVVEEVYVDVGSKVSKGQNLLRLDQTLFSIAVAEAKASLDSATLEKVDAERNFERMKKLFDKPEGKTPSISQKRFEEAENRFNQAKISVEKASEFLKKMQKNAEDATIKAPFNGVISKRFVHPGDPVTVTPVSKLIEVVSLESPYVEFSIPQKYIHHVHIGSALSAVIDGISKETMQVSIDCIYPDIDEKTRSIKCRATLKEAIPGALVEISLPIQEQE